MLYILLFKDEVEFWSCDCIEKETVWNRPEKVDHLAYKNLCVLQGSGIIKMIRTGLIKTRFKSVSRFFLFFPIFSWFFFSSRFKKKKKKKKKKNPDFFFFVFFFVLDFFFFPILSWFPRFSPYFLYSSLFSPKFSYSKGGMLLDAIFSLRILFFFFFYSRGAWLREKRKTYFFFSAHYHPCKKFGQVLVKLQTLYTERCIWDYTNTWRKKPAPPIFTMLHAYLEYEGIWRAMLFREHVLSDVLPHLHNKNE